MIPAGIVASARVEPGFTPASLPSLWAWYDASAIAGLVDSDPIAAWSDLSGNGRTVTASGTSRPLFKSSAFGTKPALLFDGSNDAMSRSGAYTPAETTIFAVVRPASLPGNQQVVGGAVKVGLTAVFNDGTIGVVLTNVAAILNSTTKLSAGMAGIIAARFSDSANTVSARINRTASGSGTSSSSPLANRSIAIGQSAGETATDFWNGHIAEVIVYSSSLSDPNVVLVEDYLQAKWGTP